MIDLVDCISVKTAETKTKKRNALEITLKDDTFFMYSSTEREKDEWIGQIGQSISKHSSMHIDYDGDRNTND
jgi:hypothetical protein